MFAKSNIPASLLPPRAPNVSRHQRLGLTNSRLLLEPKGARLRACMSKCMRLMVVYRWLFVLTW